jgi:sugar O-acyltransferase (sialic acid O-acetyltransferase NeuD family)
LGTKGFEDWVITRESAQTSFLVAIGGDKGEDRLEIQEYLESHGLNPLVAKHPTAFVADSAEIGQGSQILANATVSVDCVIGRGCIINLAAAIDHECIIGDGVHIGPGANLAGCVEVGRSATIFTGATILPTLKIGQGSVVGAGAVVLKDLPPYSVAVGSPARIIKTLQ